MPDVAPGVVMARKNKPLGFPAEGHVRCTRGEAENPPQQELAVCIAEVVLGFDSRAVVRGVVVEARPVCADSCGLVKRKVGQEEGALVRGEELAFQGTVD